MHLEKLNFSQLHLMTSKHTTKTTRFFRNSELLLTEITLLVSLNSTKCDGVIRKGKET